MSTDLCYAEPAEGALRRRERRPGGGSGGGRQSAGLFYQRPSRRPETNQIQMYLLLFCVHWSV